MAEATRPLRPETFIAHLGAQGFATAYLYRILGVGKAALQRAWRWGRSPAFLVHQSQKWITAPGRPLKVANSCARYNPAHLENAARATDLLFERLRASGRTLLPGPPPATR